MSLETGVVAKIAAAVGLAGVSSAGVYYGHTYLSPKNLLSKYDRALIDFLKEDAQDIVFEIKKVVDNTSNFAANDLTLTSGSNSVKAKVQVTVPATGSDTSFKGANAASSLTTIKTNTKTPGTWTWSCELEFKREGDNASSLNQIPNKEWIMKDTEQGLFHILKKDTTTTTGLIDSVKKQVKDAKVNFIKQCAKARSPKKNLQLDTESHSETNSPSTAYTFGFVAADGTNPTALINKKESDFKDWFKEDYSNITYTTFS